MFVILCLNNSVSKVIVLIMHKIISLIFAADIKRRLCE